MRRMDDVTTLADLRKGVDVPAFGIEMTLEEARKYQDDDIDTQESLANLFNEVLDEAQGQVHTQNSEESFIVIRIKR